MKTAARTLAAAGLITAGLIAAVAAPAVAEDWNPISRSSQYIYMVDGDSVASIGADTVALVARAPVARSARAYRIETYAFDCPGSRFKITRSVEYGDDGAETDAFDDTAAEYESVPPNSMIESIKEVVCDGNRAEPPTYPSIAAYLDSRR